MIQANVTYALAKKFSLYTGVFTNKMDFGPSIGAIGKFKIKNGIVIVNNRHTFTKEYISVLLLLTEYRPPINDKLNLYIRLQILSETNFEEAKRNIQLIRLGIAFEDYQLGLGTTFDQFGSLPIKRNNHGLFFRVQF